MTPKELEDFLKKLDKVKAMACEHFDCDHHHCPASINGCYGDECAFEAVENVIDEFKKSIVKSKEK